MPRVKILWIEQVSLDYGETKQILRDVAPEEFEDISDEDLHTLRVNRYRIPRPYYNLEPVIVVLEDMPLSNTLESIRAFLDADKKRIALEKKKKEQKKKERAEKALERKKAQLEKLKKELES